LFSAFVGEFSAFGRGVALQDGKIVAVGSARGTTEDFVALRLKADGYFDTGFGTDGKAFTDFGKSDGALAVAIHTSGNAAGRIVAVGASTAFVDGIGNGDFALARYLPA